VERHCPLVLPRTYSTRLPQTLKPRLVSQATDVLKIRLLRRPAPVVGMTYLVAASEFRSGLADICLSIL
jgi:hypothetical protein